MSKRSYSDRMLGALDVGILTVGLLILKYSTLLSFHRVLHERDAMKGNKVVRFYFYCLDLDQALFCVTHFDTLKYIFIFHH